MASLFKYRGRWRAQVTDRAGRRHTRDFRRQRDAADWLDALGARAAAAQAPELGGPTAATLAQTLRRYAELYTVRKRGARQELGRINRYLAAAGLPLLRLAPGDDGSLALREESAAERDRRVAPAWQAYLARRRESSRRTHEALAALARRRVSAIGRADLDALVATMALDGHTPSAVQKEIALLKHAFNQAAERWNWVGFRNPCLGIRLGGSEPRFVRLSGEELARLYRALADCDNPLALPLVDCAIFLTSRRSSLLKLRWSDVDLEGRTAVLRQSKSGTVTVPLARRVVELLAQLPRHPSGLVFPMTANAVKCAWDGVRAKAGLPHLQFRDLRHVGGTYYARLLPNAHLLRQVLGHRTLHMAQVYVNTSLDELVADLDAAEQARGGHLVVPPPVTVAPQAAVSRKAARIIEAVRRRRGGPPQPPAAPPSPAAAPAGARVFAFPRAPAAAAKRRVDGA